MQPARLVSSPAHRVLSEPCPRGSVRQHLSPLSQPRGPWPQLPGAPQASGCVSDPFLIHEACIYGFCLFCFSVLPLTSMEGLGLKLDCMLPSSSSVLLEGETPLMRGGAQGVPWVINTKGLGLISSIIGPEPQIQCGDGASHTELGRGT